MKQFFSHAGNFKGREIKPKLLRDHTSGVTQKALVQLSPQAFGRDLSHFFKQIGLYHDLGKYTPHFQNYLLKSGYFNPRLKRHAMFGAFVLCCKFLQNGGSAEEAMLSFYIIRHHHADLSNFDNIKTLVDEEGEEINIFKQQLASLLDDIPQISYELGEPGLGGWLAFPDRRDFGDARKQFVKFERNIRHYFEINYLFSLLIEADKLDASETPIYQRKDPGSDAVSKYVAGFNENQLRNRVRHTVLNQLRQLNLETNRLFTLTAPTGVGKTLTALDFALHLRDKVPSLRRGHIIYVLPFINIIEQSYEVYQNVFKGAGIEILAHYQYADIFRSEERMDDYEGNEQDYHQKAMGLDTWQADIVITSFVQFLHTLIGNRNKLLKKYNHLADSIIILDEVQTLRLELLPVVGATLYYLTQFLNARVILMTATKPEIMRLAFDKILSKESVSYEESLAFELLPDFEHVFASYRRTKIVPLLEINLDQHDGEEVFLNQVFIEKWSPDKACLLVVNKVNRSIALFEIIRQYFEKNNIGNPVYCLSTNIAPAHRLLRIEQIKSDFNAGHKPVLVATQVVEAGVDLDFDMGFRDLGPVDSIVQVAGRINRQSNPLNPEIPHKPLYVVDFKDCKRVYGDVTEWHARNALSGKSEIVEAEYLKLVMAYFQEVSDIGYGQSLKIFSAMKELRYSDLDEEFQVIKETPHTRSVFVLCDDRAFEVKDAFDRWQRFEISKEGFEKEYKKDFHQRIIAVPKWYTGHLTTISKDIFLAMPEDYDYETGFIRERTQSVSDTVITLSL
ncbi:MAG: CRISPR-associated helicase Cas3' [Saprospiraceae bacterium]